MDESDRLSTIKNQDEKISFKENSNDKISEEFARYFSIDDDDVVILDDSQIILHEVKIILDDLITNIVNRENHPSQIENLSYKRLLDSNNDEEYLWNKKVRFNLSNKEEEEQLSTYLFISETINSSKELKPYDQFLSNLGFDLCLEENHHNLSEIDQQKLLKYNKIFHQYKTYSCKYCSFQTNTIHVLEYHYRTPHIYHQNKYRCTYCLFQTFRLSKLRYHCYKKHHFILIHDPDLSRYPCSYCSYETHDKKNFQKHNKRCQIQQKRAYLENNLLVPNRQLNRNTNTQIKTKTISKQIDNNHSTITSNPVEIIEPILIESDHDSSLLSRSSSDDEYIVSSDDENSSSIDDENVNKRNLDISISRPKTTQQLSTKPFISSSLPLAQTPTNLSTLSKLLLLNGSPIPLNSNKSPLIPIQPRPISGTDVYQMCNICQCYIFKNDYIRHMQEKHANPSIQSQQTISTPIIILNNPISNTNPSITSVKPALILSKDPPQSPTTIFLLSTSTMNSQSILLNMIKCPWCDTNFEHIDIMTGHLMRYHRMTLAAAKVVVAEQMKIQSTSSKELSQLFQKEIKEIQKEFNDKIYWKISQPKIYLHQIDNLSCFICNINIDNIENHLSSMHQIQIKTMYTLKQCCLCGYRCEKKDINLFEHQLRTHSGVYYSLILKQFIRFEPPPPQLSKSNNRLILPSSSSQQRNLTTYTEKKFGCRKCDTSSGLFTFEELVEHLRLNHSLNVKLHRRCLICQQTYLKGKEYNQHCLEHLNDEYPSIKLRQKYIKKR